MTEAFCFSCMNVLVRADEKDCPLCGSSLPYSAQTILDLPPGTELRNRYIIGRCLGRGGFGATYIAYDRRNRDVCAVKEYFPFNIATRHSAGRDVTILGDKRADFEYYKQRFFSEAEQLRNLNSIHGIVRLYDIFSENGTAYFVMEYIDGMTLKKFLYEYKQGLPPQEALRILGQILVILSALHKNDVLHRDISLDNICLLKDGSIKLIDFGSARKTMQGGMTIFTKGIYTAPEQALGQRQGPFTDLFAVGVLMFSLFLGELPKQSETGLESMVPDGKSPLYQLEQIYRKATLGDASMRYQRAEEMLKDIQELEAIDSRALAAYRKKLSREKCGWLKRIFFPPSKLGSASGSNERFIAGPSNGRSGSRSEMKRSRKVISVSEGNEPKPLHEKRKKITDGEREREHPQSGLQSDASPRTGISASQVRLLLLLLLLTAVLFTLLIIVFLSSA